MGTGSPRAPTSPGLFASPCPILQLWERGWLLLQHWDPLGTRGSATTPSPTTALVPAPGLDPLGHPSSDAPAYLGWHFPRTYPHGPQVSQHQGSTTSHPPSPVRTSCSTEHEARQSLQRCPPYQAPPLPPSHPLGTPRATTALNFLSAPSLRFSPELCARPCGRGLLTRPRRCVEPSSLGQTEPPASPSDHCSSPGMRWGEIPLVTRARLPGLAPSSMENNFSWKEPLHVASPSPRGVLFM